MNGIELSKRFYEEYGRPMIDEQFPQYAGCIAAGIAGEGSECFGYDDDISKDHDYEAGFCLWIPDSMEHELAFKLSRAYHKLPESFMGVGHAKESLGSSGRRGVSTIGEFYTRFTGCPGVPETLFDWLYIPESALACAVNGEVYRDDLGEFTEVRETLSAGYPEDVRIKKIAARAVTMAQSGQYNYARCIKHGEPAAAKLALYEFTQASLSMIYLLNNKYMPYYKWVFRGGRELARLSGTVRDLETLILGTDDGCPVSEERTQDMIEQISAAVIEEMKCQDLTDGCWDYLEPHGLSAMERIKDAGLRNLHVLEG